MVMCAIYNSLIHTETIFLEQPETQAKLTCRVAMGYRIVEVPKVGEVDTEGSEVISALSSRGTGPPSTPADLAATENGVAWVHQKELHLQYASSTASLLK